MAQGISGFYPFEALPFGFSKGKGDGLAALAHFVISALSAVAYGGITYFRNILPVLAALDHRNRYTILVKSQHFEELRVDKPNFELIKVPACSGSAARRMIWEQLLLPRFLMRCRADAAYTANNVGLLRSRIPTVISVRNLEPFFHRDYEDGTRARFRNGILRFLTQISVERATFVVVVSEYTREVILRQCSGDVLKMPVIYHGRPEVEPDEKGASEIRQRNNIEGEYLLANGKFVPYGNFCGLVEGYGLALRSIPAMPKLLIAGGDASSVYKKKVLGLIKRHNLGGKVALAGLVPHAANLALMRSAKVFLFPSLLEACPNSLLEALAMGCVILSSDRPPMREVAGDAVCYFDPLDPSDIEKKIVEANRMSNQQVATIKSAARERSNRFTWEDSAKRLVKVLEEAATRNSGRG